MSKKNEAAKDQGKANDQAKVNDQPPANDQAPVNDQAKANDAKKAAPKTFVIKHGSLMVGKGDKRVTGDKVKATELSATELAYFTADGTLEAAE